MSATEIAEELGEDVVADNSRRVYWVPNVEDVSDLPPVSGFDPVPAPTESETQ